MASQPRGLQSLHNVLGGWTAVVLGFLYAPIVLVFVYSFNNSELNLVWHGFTPRWYGRIWSDTALMSAVQVSVVVAIFTTIVSTLLGTAAAWVLRRYRVPLGRSLSALIYVPILMPDVVIGVSLLILFGTLFKFTNGWSAFARHPLHMGVVTLVLSHVTFCFPFVAVAVRSRLGSIDPSLEEAAMDLGATPARAFWHVVVPFLLPAVLAGALMSFTLSVDELIVSSASRTGGRRRRCRPVIYGMARGRPDPGR